MICQIVYVMCHNDSVPRQLESALGFMVGLRLLCAPRSLETPTLLAEL